TQNGVIVRWAVRKGAAVKVDDLPGVTHIAVSGDGSVVAASSKSQVRVWSDGVSQAITLSDQQEILDVAVSPSGRYIAALGVDPNAYSAALLVFDRSTGQTRRSKVELPVIHIAMSTDNEIVVTSTEGFWERITVDGLRAVLVSRNTYTGVHGNLGTTSSNGAF